MLAKLVLVGGRANKRELAVKTPALLGRSDDANLVLRHPMISRRQCELIERDGQLVLRDLGSRNGTLLNDKPTKESALTSGDRLTIGPLVFEVRLKPAVNETSPPDVAPAAVETTTDKPAAVEPAPVEAKADATAASPVEDMSVVEDVAAADIVADLAESEMFEVIEEAVGKEPAVEQTAGEQPVVEESVAEESVVEESVADEAAVDETAAAPDLADLAEADSAAPAADAGSAEPPVGEPLDIDQPPVEELPVEEPQIDEMEFVDGGDFLEADVVDADLMDLVETSPTDSEPAADAVHADEPAAVDAPTDEGKQSDSGEFVRFDAAAPPPEPLGDLGDTISDPIDEDDLLANSLTPAPDLGAEATGDQSALPPAEEPVADEFELGELDLDDVASAERIEPAEGGDQTEEAAELELDALADDDALLADLSVDEPLADAPLEQPPIEEAITVEAATEPVAAGDEEFEDIFAEPDEQENDVGAATDLVEPLSAEAESTDSLDEMISSGDQMTADGTLEAFAESDSDALDLNLDDLSAEPEAGGTAGLEVPQVDTPLPDASAAAAGVAAAEDVAAMPAVDISGSAASGATHAPPAKKKRSFWPFGRKQKQAAAAAVVAAAAGRDVESSNSDGAVDALLLNDEDGSDTTGAVVDSMSEADETVVLDFDGGAAAAPAQDLALDEASPEESLGAADTSGPAPDEIELGDVADFADLDSPGEEPGEDAAEIEFAAFDDEPQFDPVVASDDQAADVAADATVAESPADEEPPLDEELALDEIGAESGDLVSGGFDDAALDEDLAVDEDAALDETVAADAVLDLDATVDIDAPDLFGSEAMSDRPADVGEEVDEESPPTVAAEEDLVLESMEPAGEADAAIEAVVLGDVEAPPISAAGRGEADTLGSSLFEDGQALEATLAVTSADDTTALAATAQPTPAKKAKRGSLFGRLLGRGKKKQPANDAPATTAADATVEIPTAEPETPVSDTTAPGTSEAAASPPSSTAPVAQDDEFMDFLADSEANDSPAAVNESDAVETAPPEVSDAPESIEMPELPDASSSPDEEDGPKDDGFDDLFKDV